MKLNLIPNFKNPDKSNTGFKLAVFDVSNGCETLKHFGMVDWEGSEWGDVPAPDGYNVELLYWYDLPNLNSKIIQLGGSDTA